MKPWVLWISVALFALGCSTGNESLLDFDGDGSLDENDCDSTDAQIYPGAADAYGDEIDSNCDGIDGTDGDGDGYPGDSTAPAAVRDCNDADATWYPGASDVVDGDGADTNCDGTDGIDADQDGWASASSGGQDCDDEDPAQAQAQDIDLDGITDCAGDCVDTDDTIYPGADEVCDGKDSDCDGVTPEDEVDGDDDGSLACDDCDDTDATVERLDTDGDGITTCAGDCDDEAAPINPFEPDQVGDGNDTNCDGIDGIDADGDGFAGTSSGGEDCEDGDPAITPETDTDADGATLCEGDCNDEDPALHPDDNDFDGASPCDGDCDDADPANTPAAPELCDGQDNNCDGVIPVDELDVDADGVWGCQGDCDDEDPAMYPSDNDFDGLSPCDGDCDDDDINNLPGGTEICDGQDNDCDSSTTAGGLEEDQDLDGFWSCEDCDDSDGGVNPAESEVCGDSIDNDCNGIIDLDADLDGDGFTTCDDDCNDASAAAYPGAYDEWGDGNDLDCDGVDGNDLDGDGYAGDALDTSADCDDTDSAVYPQDADGDGFTLCNDDCDDTDAAIFPFAADVFCDGIDSNCGSDDAAIEALEVDTDNDGYLPCAPYVGTDPAIVGGDDCDDFNAGLYPEDADGDGSTLCDGDCDDTDPNRLPTATEQACDGFDSDCSPDALEQDTDLDGQLPCEGDCDDSDDAMYGDDNDGDGRSPCGADGIAGTSDDDCDDADNTVYPGNTELCDGIDSDCVFDVTETDDDGDTYVECSPWIGSDPNIVGGQDCDDGDPAQIPIDADGDGEAGCAGDCNETDASIYPGAFEVACDGRDSDCVADAAEIDDDGDGWLDCSGYSGTIIGIDGGDDCDDTDPALNHDDADGDNHSSCNGDCDDDDNTRFPLNADFPCDGLETNCVIDTAEVDDDGDGYLECSPYTGTLAGILGGADCDDGDVSNVPTDGDNDGYTGCGGDCNDGDDTIHPGAPDSFCDGLDTDCIVDANETDDDGDGYVECAPYLGSNPAILGGADCDDASASRYSGAPELCDNIDNDCNTALPVNEIDNDGDGHTECDNDCNDADPLISPTGLELCDGVDNNCSGLLDDIVDQDSDGFTTCGADGVPNTGDEDCDDDEATTYPGATEQCDTIDNDCNGVLNDPVDQDGDGVDRCGADQVQGTLDDDCDDLDPSIYPGNTSFGLESLYGSSANRDCSPGPGTAAHTAAHIIFQGVEAGEQSGHSLAVVPDLDGDGLDEVAIGARLNDEAGSDAGKTYFFLGSSLQSSGTLSLANAHATFTGINAGDKTAISLSGDADLDGDGLNELLIGSQSANALHVIYASMLLAGGDYSLSQAGATLTGEATDDGAGYSVASLGDLDGDGRSELAIGAPLNDEVGSNAGKVYIALGSSITQGSAFALSTAHASLTGEAAGHTAGHAVASAGDIDGDGLNELLVGAPNASGGRAYVVWGSRLAVGGELSLASADRTLTEHPSAAGFYYQSPQTGRFVASAGDVDGDGIADLFVGSPSWDGTNAHPRWCDNRRGRGSIIFGATLLALSAPTRIDFAADINFASGGEFDHLGSAALGPGDLDGDGLDDFLIGRPTQWNFLGWHTYDGVPYGDHHQCDESISRADLHMGFDAASGGQNLTPRHTFSSLLPRVHGGQVGASLAGGDFDGDGAIDLLIGAPGIDDIQTDAGAVYLILNPF